MVIKEFGGVQLGQAATEVQFGSDTGEIKNKEGEVLISFDNDQNVAINTTGGTTYKPKTIAIDSAGTSVTAAQSGATVILTASGTVKLPAITTSAAIGLQFVIANAKTADITGAIIRDDGGTANFYDSDTTGGEATAQDVAAMKCKTVICIAVNQWLVIG